MVLIMRNLRSPARPAVLGVVVLSSFVLFSFCLRFQFAHAQEEPFTILITASRSAETVDETLSPVTLITRQDIEATQASTVEEVLRTVPGVTLSSNGAAGQVSTLFLRGTNSNHVLVLIDGVKVGSAINGLTQFEHLPLAQVEKIEVVRGPRSSLYGSEAIGGVIQIFTRKGSGKASSRFSVGGGSHYAYRRDLGVSGGMREGWYNVNLSDLMTDGYDVCRASFCLAERDDDGYQNRSVSLRSGAWLTDSLEVEGNFFRSAGETDFDGFYNSSQNIIRTTSVKAGIQASESWHASLLIAQTKDELESFTNGMRGSQFISDRTQLNWQNNLQLSPQSRVVAGVDYVDDEVDGSTDYEVDSRDNIGLFASLRTAIYANELEFSLRNDDNQQFGKQATGSVGWGRGFDGNKRITASYGTAFKAPNFNDLYEAELDAGIFNGMDFGVFRDNPDLQPETSKSLDLGFSHVGNYGRWGVNLFQTTIDDLIATRLVGMETVNGTDRPINMPVNIKEATIVGVEWTASTRLNDWDMRSTITWQNAKETAGDRQNKPLRKRPEQKLDLDISRQFGRHLVAVNVFAQSSSLDFGEVEIAGFTLVNLRSEIRLQPNWSLGLKINNLLSKDYETAAGYPQDGRNFFATLRYRSSGS